MANDIDPAIANIEALLDGVTERENRKVKQTASPKIWLGLTVSLAVFIVGGAAMIGFQSAFSSRSQVIAETAAFQDLTREIALQSGLSPLELRVKILKSLSE